MAVVKENYKDLLVELVRSNFKMRYNNSILGFVWVLLKPFLTFVVLYVVFSSFHGVENYALFLLLGVVIYTFINEGVTFGLNSLLDKAHIILKVDFNRTIAVVSSEIMALINFAINMIVIAVFCFFISIDITVVSFLYFVFIMMTVFLGLITFSLFFSIFLVRFRDLQNIADLALQLLFYGSAIFYPIESVPERFRFLIEYNPVYILIEAARVAFVSGEIIYVREVMIILVVAIVFFVLGVFYFSKNVKKVAEYF